MTTALALWLALTCADGTCDLEDWGPTPAAVDAVDAEECHVDDAGCADLHAWTAYDPHGTYEPYPDEEE